MFTADPDRRRALASALLGPVLLACCGAAPADTPVQAAAPASFIEEVTVLSQLREAPLRDVATSVAVLDAAQVRDAAIQHFEELTLRVANLNWSGEGSRARFFQIRGIGELEQYEGAPNPSVGFIIDDIDLSALGAAATLFDVDRVEVLRGPQGTRYGANALAGLIYVRSTDPGEQLESFLEGTLGNDATRALGAILSGPLPGMEDRLAARLSLQHYTSDGFRSNAWLGRSDTYGREEFTGRLKLRWRPGEDLRVDLTGLYIDMDNGYDAWSIDNGFSTWSDEPGRDEQRTVALSARLTASHWPIATLTSITGFADTDALFSFDADWGNPDFWAPFVYDFTQSFARERRTLHQELRLSSLPAGRLLADRADWTLGLYLLDLDEQSLERTDGAYDDGEFGFAVANGLQSDYRATSVALFGELTLRLATDTTLGLGLRGERRSARYRDQFRDRLDPDADAQANRFRPTDRMLGGELTLSHALGERSQAWARVARGYKAGGFNPGLARVLAGIDPEEVALNLGPAQLEFRPEYLWNHELGLRTGTDARWSAEISLFWQRRKDAQLRFSEALIVGDPASFVLFSDNAERARTRGLEANARWSLTETLQLSATLGLLDTEVRRFSAWPLLEGRELAHAPRWSYTVGLEWHHPDGWFARGDVGGRDRFYYDFSHDQRSTSYSVVDVRLGRHSGRWRAELWARNLLDRRYYVRGFYFGNEPPDFPETLYTRLADPRHFGARLSYRY